ncbi:hypothetical protein [Rubritepida flocculans]|uniref:hypothetical protein n=1 Tax=Rubritepida flocculans TaxID=182403 RepID=UPI000425384B|nr:hypothetical protein [Rubritepida flocculans]
MSKQTYTCTIQSMAGGEVVVRDLSAAEIIQLAEASTDDLLEQVAGIAINEDGEPERPWEPGELLATAIRVLERANARFEVG